MDSKEFALVSGSPVSVSDGKEVSSVYDQIWRGTDFSKTSEAIWTAEYEAGELNVYNELTWVVNSSTYDSESSSYQESCQNVLESGWYSCKR